MNEKTTLIIEIRIPDQIIDRTTPEQLLETIAPKISAKVAEAQAQVNREKLTRWFMRSDYSPIIVNNRRMIRNLLAKFLTQPQPSLAEWFVEDWKPKHLVERAIRLNNKVYTLQHPPIGYDDEA